MTQDQEAVRQLAKEFNMSEAEIERAMEHEAHLTDGPRVREGDRSAVCRYLSREEK